MSQQEHKINQSIFPDFPRGSPVINKEGNFTEVWHLQMSSLFQALQKTFSNEGFQLPRLSNDDMNTILSFYTAAIGKTLQNARLPNISGRKAFNFTTESEKTFIINFTPTGNQSGTISAVAWKTVTLT